LSYWNKSTKFEVNVLQHLDAAYNLARWILANESDARDVVQTASLRALTYMDSLRGNEAKAWFLGIVRNCCLTLLSERTQRLQDFDIDELIDGDEELATIGSTSTLPEHEILRHESRIFVNQALAMLPIGFREVLILREMEDLSYEQISLMMAVPIGTVMSRLARARQTFKQRYLQLTEGKFDEE
jgi:RNA polymerase sigma-70 factor, ECF subfamily